MTMPVFDGSQHTIAETLDPLLARQSKNVSESRTLAAIRDLLLPKLISGEIRIKKAEEALEAIL